MESSSVMSEEIIMVYLFKLNDGRGASLYFSDDRFSYLHSLITLYLIIVAKSINRTNREFEFRALSSVGKFE